MTYFSATLPVSPLNRPESSPAFNIANTFHESIAGSKLPPSRPSQYSSTGIDLQKIENSCKEDLILSEDRKNELNGIDDNKRGVQLEVEEIRKKSSCANVSSRYYSEAVESEA